jgi:hypothetical protein
MFLSSTDLPVPDGPMTAVIWPRGMSKVMSRRTVWLPKDFVTSRSEMTASRAPHLPLRALVNPQHGVTADTGNLTRLAPGLRTPLGVEALEAGLG